MKLNVILLRKCPRCGRTMNVVKAWLGDGKTLIFRYCPNSECRYAEEEVRCRK